MTQEEKIQLVNDFVKQLISAGINPDLPDDPENNLDNLTEQELDELLEYFVYKGQRPKPVPHV